jgi:hypothetical protein
MLEERCQLPKTGRELIDLSLSGSNRSANLLEGWDGDESKCTGTQSGNDKRTGKSAHSSHSRRESRGNEGETK